LVGCEYYVVVSYISFFFQAEDGIRDATVTGVQTCALPISTVVLYTIQGGGHSWPGGKPLPQWWVGPTSRSIDATSQMWTFFREHQLLRKVGKECRCRAPRN